MRVQDLPPEQKALLPEGTTFIEPTPVVQESSKSGAVTIGELKKYLNSLDEECDDYTINLEGCDCTAPCYGVEIGGGELYMMRSPVLRPVPPTPRVESKFDREI